MNHELLNICEEHSYDVIEDYLTQTQIEDSKFITNEFRPSLILPMLYNNKYIIYRPIFKLRPEPEYADDFKYKRIIDYKINIQITDELSELDSKIMNTINYNTDFRLKFRLQRTVSIKLNHLIEIIKRFNQTLWDICVYSTTNQLNNYVNVVRNCRQLAFITNIVETIINFIKVVIMRKRCDTKQLNTKLEQLPNLLNNNNSLANEFKFCSEVLNIISGTIKHLFSPNYKFKVINNNKLMTSYFMFSEFEQTNLYVNTDNNNKTTITGESSLKILANVFNEFSQFNNIKFIRKNISNDIYKLWYEMINQLRTNINIDIDDIYFDV